ncbi:btb (poz) domain-containing 2a-related [Anaeramoeba flamelloides]|uniref:Btb (Poz) domain-containing 2a-related n=1 Tax=Anaeramoeba flamelloides TaxID=1746091 RepID=A0ABQ8Y304_9EUKA|nr:btb (poz) domain-containing 2a-related [Anaeramoeba flamelloides]
MLERLKKQINNEEIADVKFLVGKEETEMYGHKSILAISCPMFKTLFYFGNWKEVSSGERAEVRIPDLTSDHFLSLLEYCYIGETEFTFSNVFPLFYASDKFMMPDLTYFCLDWILKNTKEYTALSILNNVIKIKQTRLAKQTMSYVVRRCNEIFSIQGCLNELEEQTIRFIFQFNENSKGLEKVGNVIVLRLQERALFVSKRDPKKSLVKELQRLLSLINFEIDSGTEFTPLNLSKLAPFPNLNKPLKVLLLCELDIEGKLFVNTLNQSKSSKMIFNQVSLTSYKLNDTEFLTQHQAIIVFFSLNSNRQGDKTKIGDLIAHIIKNYHMSCIFFAPMALIVENLGDLSIKGRITEKDFLPFEKGNLRSSNNWQLKKSPENFSHPLLPTIERFESEKVQTVLNIKNCINENAKIIHRYENDIYLVAEMDVYKSKICFFNYYPIVSNQLIGKDLLFETIYYISEK